MKTASITRESVLRHPGVPVAECVPRTPAWKAGIRAGDRVLYIDDAPIRDSIDLHFHAAEERFSAVFRRGDEILETVVERPHGELLGMIPEDPPIRECSNFCPFCFVDQAPKDRRLRPGLEIRDDDYRYSFLHGHYVTLTNLSRADKARIREMRLSPLYVSVHATDPDLRARLLGRPRVPILPLLQELTEAGIELHTQVVLWPGVNDGDALERTVRELHELHPGVASVAAVPVGLTDHHHMGVERWTRDGARGALDQILALGERYPAGFLQAADEWFAMLGIDPPPIGYYGGMQVEANGVGLVRRLLDEWRTVRLPRRVSRRSYLVLTGASPRIWIERIVEDLRGVEGIEIELRSIENRIFGSHTTVTGLLGWSDLRDAVAKSGMPEIVIPDVMLDGYGRFLDDVSLEEAERDCGRIIHSVPASAAGFRVLLDARRSPMKASAKKRSVAKKIRARRSGGGENRGGVGETRA